MNNMMSNYYLLLKDCFKVLSLRDLVKFLIFPISVTVVLFLTSYFSVANREILVAPTQLDNIIDNMIMFTSVMFPFTVAMFTIFASGGENIKELKETYSSNNETTTLYQKLLNLLTINLFLTIFVTVSWLIMKFSLIIFVTHKVLMWLFINMLLTFTMLLTCLDNALNIYFVLWKNK